MIRSAQRIYSSPQSVSRTGLALRSKRGAPILCSAFFTDSFHGCVFSLVFRRQFFALRREGRTEDMSGRIATLLNMVGLEDRAVADGDPLPSVITPERFEQVHQALAYRRAESTALLRDVLGEQG